MWPPAVVLMLLLGASSTQRYLVPEPRLEALWPTGIRVSIPDSPGVELFAFHGSVNKPLRYLAAGDMSRDIIEPQSGRWIFEDLTVQLRPEDVVYYWLYVQVYGRGYQRTNLYWIIESYVTNSTDEVPLPQGRYTVPEAVVEPLQPRGLRVSIPDSPGIEIFAFHGNVNRPMSSLEAGTMSKDVMYPTNGRWVFEDPDVELKKGDTIYYWTYVIRCGLGYRRDNQKFVVNDLNPALSQTNATSEESNVTGMQEEAVSTTETPDGMRDVTLPEGMEFRVVVKDGRLQIIPIIPETDRRIAV
ncbi:uncharacterized protein [Anabrus simplex]|uniref:uncharacterized protein n=1 Tax=Anabrus simplex TaxID=316456 RepID=UPI0034DDA5F3